jgi:hypothetical protein
MTSKPPWFASNAAERAAMVQWMHRKLDDQQAEMMRPAGNSAKHRAWLKADGPQIYHAERGNIELLRKKYPLHARFLDAPPPRKQVNDVRDDAITTAVFAVEQIRRIWKNEYDRKNRQTGQRPTALEIAALWMDVSEEDILKRMKPSGPSGKKLSRAD